MNADCKVCPLCGRYSSSAFFGQVRNNGAGTGIFIGEIQLYVLHQLNASPFPLGAGEGLYGHKFHMDNELIIKKTKSHKIEFLFCRIWFCLPDQ